MEDKEAALVLQEILERHMLDMREVEAVKTAIGVLSWTKLVEGYVERRKKARDRRMSTK